MTMHVMFHSGHFGLAAHHFDIQQQEAWSWTKDCYSTQSTTDVEAISLYQKNAAVVVCLDAFSLFYSLTMKDDTSILC